MLNLFSNHSYDSVISGIRESKIEEYITGTKISSILLLKTLKENDMPNFNFYYLFFLKNQQLEPSIFRPIISILTKRKDEASANMVMATILRNRELFLSLSLHDNHYKFLLLCLFQELSSQGETKTQIEENSQNQEES